MTDGAWGTQLQERGLAVGACPDAWNLTQPEKVEEVARAYVEAGSQAILTNTFGANRPRLEANGLGEQVAAINPKVVYLQSNGYGPDGPGALRPSTHPIPGACMGGDPNYKCITVTVTDAGGGTLSRLQAAVANY